MDLDFQVVTMPLAFDPEQMRHAALKNVVSRIMCVEVVKEFTEWLERLTRVQDDDTVDEVDIPTVERPMKCFFGNL